MIEALVVGQLYSNEEIFCSLKVSNAGGIRVAVNEKGALRAAVMTSLEGFHSAVENPYHDRLEGGVLAFTAAGRVGEQALSGANLRLIEQRATNFPIHGFIQIASRRDRSVGPKRWRYLGLLEYVRHYADTQLDVNGKIRKVWLFEFKIHSDRGIIEIATDSAISSEILVASRLQAAANSEDDEIIGDEPNEEPESAERIEHVRSTLLALEPRGFELFVKDLLVHCGFSEVCVTRFSADGGVDVNARAGSRNWIFEGGLVQVQAKRWLHSVGRKEIAELRGSLQPFAKGAVITTSHFSRAAIKEASELGKNPVTLVDGFRLSQVVLAERFDIPT
jgi:hypothetical protein